MFRLFVARDGSLPFSLIPSLDRATEPRFLHRVGGGYTSIHDLLRDYIADLDLAEWERRLANEGLLDKRF